MIVPCAAQSSLAASARHATISAGKYMPDISVRIEWWEFVLVSPLYGWPGLFAGAALGAALAPKRRILAGAIGAIIGNFIVFFVRIMLK